MRIASILLALVVVLGFASEAVAMALVYVDNDFTISVGSQKFGFIDGTLAGDFYTRPFCRLYLGQFGIYNVPFTATQSLLGFCVIVVGMIALLATLTVRWKRRSRV